MVNPVRMGGMNNIHRTKLDDLKGPKEDFNQNAVDPGLMARGISVKHDPNAEFQGQYKAYQEMQGGDGQSDPGVTTNAVRIDGQIQGGPSIPGLD